MAINCVDSPYPRTSPPMDRGGRKADEGAPLFGPYVMWGTLPCAYWPVKPTLTNRPSRAEGAAPILVVGTNRDPATPYAWAQALAAQLDSGVLLGFDGDGHTAYLQGSPCVDDAVDQLPDHGHAPTGRNQLSQASADSRGARTPREPVDSSQRVNLRHAALAQSARALHS